MKKWWKSKTFWVNALTALAGFLTYVVGQDFVPQDVVAFVTAVVIPVVNIFLRWVTDMPLASMFRKADAVRDARKARRHKA